MPTAYSNLNIGYDESTDSIWLLGGTNENGSPAPPSVVKFDVQLQTFVQQPPLPINPWNSADSQSYTQINDLIYMVVETTSSLATYNLRTKEFIPNWDGIVLPSTSYSSWACLTNIADKYLIYLGGQGNDGFWSKETLIYDISAKSWVPNVPDMNERRSHCPCQVHNNWLYAIGGRSFCCPNNWLNSVEKLYVGDISNIQNQQWILVTQTLSQAKSHSRSIVSDDSIYIIGGFINVDTATNVVERIDTTNNDAISVDSTVSTPLMNTAAMNTAAVMARDRIYVFGGYTWDAGSLKFINSWSKSTLLHPTLNPTRTPTTRPTAVPTMYPTTVPSTEPTTFPSTEPTYHPTAQPTFIPTFEPTYYPTFIPTYEPTYVPTYYPTSIPTFHPTVTPLIDTIKVPSNSPTIRLPTESTGAQMDNEATNSNSFVVIVFIISGVVLVLITVAIALVFWIKITKNKTSNDTNTEIKSISEIQLGEVMNVKAIANEDDVDKSESKPDSDSSINEMFENVETKKINQTNHDMQDNENENEELYNGVGSMYMLNKKCIDNKTTIYEEIEKDEQLEGVANATNMVNESEVGIWLKSLGDAYYNDYYTLFIDNGYDEIKIVATMNDDELQQIGVNKMGHRRNLIMKIAKLSNNE
eukprot:135047_1